MNITESEVLHFLSGLSEETLQNEVIEPLLGAWQFSHVRRKAGPGEHGNDLIAIFWELGKPIYGIQIKKVKSAGKISAANHPYEIFNQLQQMMTEEVVHPLSGDRQKIHRAIFITPFSLPSSAIDSAQGRILEAFGKGLRIIDGTELASLVIAKIPHVVQNASMELAYRLAVSDSVRFIPESSAFGLSRQIELEKTYVEVKLTRSASSLLAIASTEPPISEDCFIVAVPDELPALTDAIEIFGAGKAEIQRVPETSKFKGAIKIEFEELQRLISALKKGETAPIYDNVRLFIGPDVNIRRLSIYRWQSKRFLQTLQFKANDYLTNFAAMGEENKEPELATRTIKCGLKLEKQLNTLLSHQCLYRNNAFTFFSVKARKSFPLKSPDILLNLKLPIFIFGAPGAGKTTLVRTLCKRIAADTATFPLLLPIIDLPSRGNCDLTAAAKQKFAALGYEINGREFETLLRKGNVRAFFDGLDEAGDGAKDALARIAEFHSRFPACPLIITARDSIRELAWPEVLQIHLAPFDDNQIDEFVGKWFSCQPTKADELRGWLKTNQEMRDAARRPMITTLLCSLMDVGAEMPNTEIELYEKRFDLLLGGWDKAKGIAPLSPSIRQRYWHFLMEIGIETHRRGARTIEFQLAATIAKEFFTLKYHKNPDVLVHDCVKRGLLELDPAFAGQKPSSDLSFGHLTYQEFLAARSIKTNGNVAELLQNLMSPWWDKVARLYASMTANISPLIVEFLRAPRTNDEFKRVELLSGLAELTPRTVMARFHVEHNSLVRSSSPLSGR